MCIHRGRGGASETRLPRGTRPFRGEPHVRAAFGNPAILSFFSDPNAPAERYVLVVNRSPNRASRTRLTISGTVKSVERFDPSISASGEFVSQPLAGAPPRFLYATSGAGRAVLYRKRTA